MMEGEDLVNETGDGGGGAGLDSLDNLEERLRDIVRALRLSQSMAS